MAARPVASDSSLQHEELADALRAAAEPDVLPEAGLSASRQAAALAGVLGRASDEALARSWSCTHLGRMGRLAELLEQAPTVMVMLADTPHRDRHREVLRHVTLAASELGRYGIAIDAAHRLMEMAQASGRADDALAASFLLAACLERMGDSWQALRLLADAVSAYGEDQPSQPLLLASNGISAICLGLAHRLRDTGSDDELAQLLHQGCQQGERALALLQRVRGDTYDVAVPGNLGEILLMQGRIDEARPLLDRALDLAQARGLHAHSWRVGASLANWHLAAGDAPAARGRALALIAELGEQGPPQTAIRARDVAYRACRSLGLAAEALEHLEVAERLERKRSIAQLRSQSQVLVTRSEADRAHADAAQQRQRAAEYAAAAERDALTGLGNRRHLDRRCAELLAAQAASATPLALAVLDLDHFKAVNDRHGHPVGDQVLVQVAQLLRDNTRSSDVLVRFGGEEFVIVLPGMTLAAAAEVCERLRERVAGHAWPQQLSITTSIGLTAAPPFALEGLLAAADAALYRAKAEGRNRVVAG